MTTTISWPFVAQAIAALLIAWNLKRKEIKLAESGNGKRVCDLHQHLIERLSKGDEAFADLTENMGVVKRDIAVIIERLEHIKEQVADNKITTLGQYNNILKKLE